MGFDRLFYYPDRNTYGSPDGQAFEPVTFRTSDGLALHGWFFPAVGTSKGTVVHFHGNAGNITAHFTLISWLPDAGYNVLVFDYRGYGRSQGEVTREGTIIDGHAAVDYVLTRSDVDPERLFALGQSLGGAVAIVVAAERPELRAVVAESAFGRYRGIAAVHARRMVLFRGVAGALAASVISSGYDPIEFVGRLAPRPLLVVAAGRDSICPAELSRELFEAAAEPKSYWLVAEAEHLSALQVDVNETIRRLERCFEQGVAPAS